MNATARHWLRRSAFGAAAATLLAGCAGETPLGPGRQPASAHRDLAGSPGVCEQLNAPAGSELAFHAYAAGVQIYRWSGTSWVFVEPAAVLYADAAGNGVVGTHYAGPTWRSVSGSTVVGAVIDRCTPDPTAIPWLLLGAASSDGPGVFAGTRFIQRVHTVGGNAPADAGSFVGESTEVPYTAEYNFYR